MYILNTTSAIKKMSVNELRDLLSLKIIINELYLLKKEVIIQ